MDRSLLIKVLSYIVGLFVLNFQSVPLFSYFGETQKRTLFMESRRGLSLFQELLKSTKTFGLAGYSEVFCDTYVVGLDGYGVAEG
ncbi:hypothetical protein [Desulfogranum mediterraneum]|uniref:hypothetical protein n=1 Tax=Desulfogranum mediterraneum TaxID=160661 RepID=UPI00048D0381|nr:hypothetical protein [Desulfogranum mediterraneum]